MNTYIAKIRLPMGNDECITEHMLIYAKSYGYAMAHVLDLYNEEAMSIKISFVDEGLICISEEEYNRIYKEYGAE